MSRQQVVPGVDYVSTVTWRMRIPSPAAPDVLNDAVKAAERARDSSDGRRPADDRPPVEVEPVVDERGRALIVRVVLSERVRDTNPLHDSVARAADMPSPTAGLGAEGTPRGADGKQDLFAGDNIGAPEMLRGGARRG